QQSSSDWQGRSRHDFSLHPPSLRVITFRKMNSIIENQKQGLRNVMKAVERHASHARITIGTPYERMMKIDSARRRWRSAPMKSRASTPPARCIRRAAAPPQRTAFRGALS
ncbi:unnamed protein product, partial [Phaeothamnion confervicola]